MEILDVHEEIVSEWISIFLNQRIQGLCYIKELVKNLFSKGKTRLLSDNKYLN